MNFENQIQQWVVIDNQLKMLNAKTKELREKRNSLTNDISNYAYNNSISNKLIEISDGKIKIINSKIVEPLTFKYVEKTLGEVIKNETHVKMIIEHLKQKRESKIVPEIKRFSNN
jgi:FtsZ-binding cell division protein ZapB